MTDKGIEVIVKAIFTKMFNSNFSACEYGIECYKKGMEYQGIKELTIENDNLIKRIKELEHQLIHRNCVDCSNHSSKLKMRTLELEKENAELKAQIEKMKCCSNCENWNWKHSKCEKKLKGDCFKHSKWVMRNI